MKRAHPLVIGNRWAAIELLNRPYRALLNDAARRAPLCDREAAATFEALRLLADAMWRVSARGVADSWPC